MGESRPPLSEGKRDPRKETMATTATADNNLFGAARSIFRGRRDTNDEAPPAYSARAEVQNNYNAPGI
jgi:hypothetical protein